ncbi:uncharacterized protein LOC132869066 [Neoarius graeffei]|uniref:uncharacterized protein LOC132869066 n=1 Tax=Neoarius graeffei TaxID=443677 RepID=UPI00298D1F55|nr:uncharacterized protein LOC132869066 [Neoarius graeffei]
MLLCFYLLLLHHITEGCWLEGNGGLIKITAYTGDSVLLPCSCTDLQTTPETFKWEKLTTNEKNWVKISPESDQYKERFQLVNDRSSGNLSLLISTLTEEDGGDYRCSVKGSQYRDIRLTVKDAPTKPSTSAPVTRTTSPHSKPDPQHIYISVGVVMALLLLLIFGGVMYWKHIEQRRRQTEISDGQTGQQTQQKKNFTEPMNLIATSEPTYESVHTQNDSVVPYTAINPQSQRNNVEEKDDVTYSTVVHGNTVRAAHTQQASGDTTVYASIKTN